MHHPRAFHCHPDLEPRLIAVDTPHCEGTGGPPDVYDEDTGRSVSFVCSRCSGSGSVRRWTDQPA